MKKTIALLLFLGLFCQFTIAQTPSGRGIRTAEERAEATTARLTRRLNLNEDQAGKIKVIQLERFQKTDALKTKYKETDDKVEARGEVKTIHTETDQKMKEVLTPEQYAQYEQQRQEQFQKHQDRDRARRNGGK